MSTIAKHGDCHLNIAVAVLDPPWSDHNNVNGFGSDGFGSKRFPWPVPVPFNGLPGDNAGTGGRHGTFVRCAGTGTQRLSSVRWAGPPASRERKKQSNNKNVSRPGYDLINSPGHRPRACWIS